MRFPKPALVVGSPVAPNCADVATEIAASFTWERDEKGWLCAFEGRKQVITVGPNGKRPSFNAGVSRGSFSVLSHAIECPTEAEAKRAAVLALASHLVEQRAKAEIVIGVDMGIGSDSMADGLRCGGCGVGEGCFHQPACPVLARDRLVSALAKSPAPPAEEVAKIVEGRRPFAVGDRVRVLPSRLEHHGHVDEIKRSIGREGRICMDARKRIPDFPWTVDVDGVTHIGMRECDIEHAASSFTWAQEGSFGYHEVRSPDGALLMRAFGATVLRGVFYWRAWTPAAVGKSADIGGEATTLDAAKAAAEAAYAKATR